MTGPTPVVDPHDDRAIYKQVADQVRARIDRQEFRPGQRLPSETKLMRTYQVSRATVRRALGQLTQEGRVRSERGRGVFVMEARRLVIHDPASFLRGRTADENESPLEKDARAQGFDYTQDFYALHEVAASERVAALLEIESGALVFARQRVVRTRRPGSANFEPAKLADSYLPLDIAVGKIREKDSGPGGTYERIREQGHRLDHFDEHLIFRMPDPDEARRLKLDPGVPIIDQMRVARTRERPVECFLAVLAGDKHAIEYRIHADHAADNSPSLPPALLTNPIRGRRRATAQRERTRETVDFSDDRPVYKQIADTLRSQIDQGGLQPGDRLPSETTLTDRFGVTRTTVRRAIGELTAEGRVRAERGVGVFVKEVVRADALTRKPYDRLARHHYIQEGRTGLSIDAESRGRRREELRHDRLELGEVPAPKAVAERLQIAAGTPVFRRRRRMRLGSLPTQLTDSYLPVELATGALREESLGDGGAYARLEEVGIRMTHFTERLSVRMPSPREAHALQLEAGVPVVDLYQTAHAGDRPIECFVSVIAGDRFTFSYRIDA